MEDGLLGNYFGNILYLNIISAILNSSSVSIIRPDSNGISYGRDFGRIAVLYFNNFSTDFGYFFF